MIASNRDYNSRIADASLSLVYFTLLTFYYLGSPVHNSIEDFQSLLRICGCKDSKKDDERSGFSGIDLMNLTVCAVDTEQVFLFMLHRLRDTVAPDIVDRMFFLICFICFYLTSV